MLVVARRVNRINLCTSTEWASNKKHSYGTDPDLEAMNAIALTPYQTAYYQSLNPRPCYHEQSFTIKIQPYRAVILLIARRKYRINLTTSMELRPAIRSNDTALIQTQEAKLRH